MGLGVNSFGIPGAAFTLEKLLLVSVVLLGIGFLDLWLLFLCVIAARKVSNASK